MNWVREKFAERRARWLAARNKRTDAEATESNYDSSETLSGSPVDRHRSETDNGAPNERSPAHESSSSTTSACSITPPRSTPNRTPMQVRKVFRASGQQQQQQQQTRSRSINSNSSTLTLTDNVNRIRSQSMIGGTSSCPITALSIPANSAPATPQRSARRVNSGVASTRTTQCLTPQLSTRITKLRRHCSTPNGTPIHSNTTSVENVLLAGLKERLRVRVICPSARVLAFQTDSAKRLAELKNEVILELADDPASMPLFATDMRSLSPRYRLFRADFEGVELNEAFTLSQLNILNNETLVLVARRNYLQQALVRAQDTRAPHDTDIEIATRDMPITGAEMPLVDINEIFQQSNIQFDVRKVLISLAQASAAIIGAGPYAARLIEMLKQKLINKRNYQNDRLQCLVDMGFTSELADLALKMHNNSYSAALEYLIQRQNDDNDMNAGSSGTPTTNIPKSQSLMSPSGILTNNDVIQNTSALLEIVRIYSHREIPPTADTVTALVEMGFAETDVLQALRKTCNNKAAACEWLCGNRTGSLFELRDGLAQDSPILKVILEMPQVQMNLSNPKILLAFLSILENENTIRVWGGDNDTTSVITHILQKYHEEKHVLGINQFYLNRL